MSNIIPSAVVNNVLIAKNMSKEPSKKDLSVSFYEEGVIFYMNEGVCRFIEQRILTRPEEVYTSLTELLSQRLFDIDNTYSHNHLTSLCYKACMVARDSVTTIIKYLADGGTLQDVFSSDSDMFMAKKEVVLITIYATMTRQEVEELIKTGFVNGMNAVDLLAFINSVYG